MRGWLVSDLMHKQLDHIMRQYARDSNNQYDYKAEFTGPPTTWQQALPAISRSRGSGIRKMRPLKAKEAQIIKGLVAGGNNHPALLRRLRK